MKIEQVPPWLRRALRTWLQAFLGSLLLSLTGLPAGMIPAAEWWVQALRIALFAAAVATLTSAVSALQNAGEDSGRLPPLLKSPAEQRAVQSDSLTAKAQVEAKRRRE